MDKDAMIVCYMHASVCVSLGYKCWDCFQYG